MDILFTNIEQLTSVKKTELEQRISKEKPSLVAICEAKPKHGVKELNEYKIDGFQLFHSNLNTASGRGIAVYAHNSKEKSVAQLHSDAVSEEYCFLEIKLRNNDKMLFGCIYRSPTSRYVLSL